MENLKCWKEAPEYLQGNSVKTWINEKTKEEVWVQKREWLGNKPKNVGFLLLSSKRKNPIRNNVRFSFIANKFAEKYMKEHDKC